MTPKPFVMNRIIIYSSDIMRLTDKSESFARKEIRDLKKFLNKDKHQKVSIKEYCLYYGLTLEDVLKVLFK